MNIIGENFSIVNFSNRLDSIQILCKNIYTNKSVEGLPLKVSWTHEDQYFTIFSDKHGIATFEFSSIWSRKLNQVLRFEIDYEYLRLDTNTEQFDLENLLIALGYKRNMFIRKVSWHYHYRYTKI